MNEFDPITGEPIKEEENTEAAAFKPEEKEAAELSSDNYITNKEPSEEAFENVQNYTQQPTEFDPMTGAPVYTQQSTEYDPMTGKPVTIQASTGFDPMTGEPIAELPSEVSYDPITGEPIKNKKGGLFKKIIIGIAAVIVIAAVAVGAVKSGLFLGNNDKVFLAAINTFSEKSLLAEDLDFSKITSSGNYTVSSTIVLDEGEFGFDYINEKDQKQLNIGINSDETEFEINTALTKDTLKFSVPLIYDKVLVYNYKEEATGYIDKEIYSNYIEAFNSSLEALYSDIDINDIMEFADNLHKTYNEDVKFEKVKKEKFEIDGKKRNCVGYAAVITDDTLLDFLDIIVEMYEEKLGDSDVYKNVIKEMRNNIKEDIKGMDDVDLTVFIYKNKLACIRIEYGKNDAEILFQGGKTRMQNVIVEADGEEIITLEGKSDKNSEEAFLEINADGEAVSYEYEYNAKTGALYFGISGDKDIEIDATVTNNNKGIEVSIENMDIENYYEKTEGIEGEISIMKGAEPVKFEGDEFDIGSASESDFEELFDEIGNFDLYSLLNDSLIYKLLCLF